MPEARKETRGGGVYFSANDDVFDWAMAFLNSFRHFNPTLPLALIPFDERCDRVSALAGDYGFEILADPAFARLETIGQKLELGQTPYGRRWFRRYAAFRGPFEEFLYLDVRQVALAPLDHFVSAPRRHGFDLVHYDVALDQVYEPGAWRIDLLRSGRRPGFLSGLWASRKGLFSIEDMEGFADAALAARDQLNTRNTDQAFFNLCCDLKRVRIGHIAELEGDLCAAAWAGQRGSVYRDTSGAWRLWDHGGLDHQKRLILLHWAGIVRQRGRPRARLFHRFRTLRLQGIRRSLDFSLGVAGDGLRRLAYAPIRWKPVNRLVARLRRPAP